MTTQYSPFIKWIAKRNKTGNTDILIVGKRRIGKSWFALALAHRYYRYLLAEGLVSEGFSVQRNVIFEVDDWLRRVKELGRYDMVILDDAGTQIPSQKWYDKVVMTTLIVYQSYAELGINTIITVPMNKLVSQKLLPLSHLYGVMQGRGQCKFYQPREHETRDKTLLPHFADVQTSPPPKAIQKEYVAAKLAYLERIYNQYSDEMRLERSLAKKRMVSASITVNDVIQQILAAPDNFRDDRGRIHRDIVWAKVEGCDKHKATAAVNNIKADRPELYQAT